MNSVLKLAACYAVCTVTFIILIRHFIFTIETTDVVRYKLMLVESNKKSVVCVEHQLTKDETRWSAHQSAKAKVRLLKEKQYLNNCATSQRLQQQ